MDALSLAQFVVGLGFLVLGAEWLVKGASRLAATLGISPLVIGLTVVSYGTSAPEVAVGVKSVLAGQADLALGNVVGSNIFNILLILGASATIAPLVVSSQLVRLDVPIMVGLSVLTLILASKGSVTRVEGALLFAGALAYTAFQIRQSSREPVTIRAEYASTLGVARNSTPKDIVVMLAGLALLVVGSRWLVAGAVAFAKALGVSELVIGLTIVAAGTSLPEVATSVLAAVRGERDIAVGNVVGSNIFNILCVLGLSALASPLGLSAAEAVVRFDLPVMVAVAVACLPIFASGAVIARWEGALFLFYYVAYTAYVVLQAQQHDSLSAFSTVMGAFVLPLTGITLAVVTWQTWSRRPSA